MADPLPENASQANGRKPVSRNADLRVRFLSALVMVAVAGGALALGGLPLRLFIVLIGIGLLYEFSALVRGFVTSMGAMVLWMLGGVAYIGVACFSLIHMPDIWRWVLIGAVIATDTGAYFAGRRFGGPKIAPTISPSKTWSGLFGGMAGASVLLLLAGISIMPTPLSLVSLVLCGCVLAVVAQAGDFFESWMKRRAGVKDSGALIPGHGGLFDRVDGLLSVSALTGIAIWSGLL